MHLQHIPVNYNRFFSQKREQDTKIRLKLPMHLPINSQILLNLRDVSNENFESKEKRKEKQRKILVIKHFRF